MKKGKILACLILFQLAQSVWAGNMQPSPRKVTYLKSWEFSHDGKSWEQVRVPHDWAIAGPFDRRNDMQVVAIKENCERRASGKTGRTGALPWIGKGEYVTSFQLDDMKGHVALWFDGAMSSPVVYVNGKEAGGWEYGYTPFELDITPYIVKGKNTVRVCLENKEKSSRWYPGAGLYRPVKLIVTNEQRIDSWQTFFRTIHIADNKASVMVDTKVLGKLSHGNNVRISLFDEAQCVASYDGKIGDDGMVTAGLLIANPRLWSPETPHLYGLRIQLLDGDRLMDETVQKVGIRTISFSKEHGFQLNGVSRKIKGVCLHHDLGPLGAAENRAAMIRQIRIMKEMGADAIRTSHHIPSEMQMQVCDSMGMMVMAESLDGWKRPKVRNGYNLLYDTWWKKDIRQMITGRRNHPSIIMYCIGNEISDLRLENGKAMTQEIVDYCHQLDDTRPTVLGINMPESAAKRGIFDVIDIPGFNYAVGAYQKLIPRLRQGFILGSETASTVSSRGVYHFPVSEAKIKDGEYADNQCSSYDTQPCRWSNVPDVDFMAQDDYPYTIGQFVWTGFDYLGEPTPYDSFWPARSSYFGIVDLAGLPKDRYYLYRSQWNKKQHTLHILPHWNWEGREGELTPVYVYTDYHETELFVNGLSQGRLKKGTATLDRYRLRWNGVKYTPGELKVVAYHSDGTKADSAFVRTAGKPTTLSLQADRCVLKADGEDLSFITVAMTDVNGNECPTLDDDIHVEVEGAGTFRGICNGDATSLTPFTEPRMKLFSGKLVIVIQSAERAGTITVKIKNETRNIVRKISIGVENAEAHSPAKLSSLDKSQLPVPVYDAHPEYVDLYWKAWELAWGRVKHQEGIPQSPYMDENLWEHTVWIWDTEFMTMFCKYAPKVFPGIESLNNFYQTILNRKKSALGVWHPDNPAFYSWVEYEYAKFTDDNRHLRQLMLVDSFPQRHYQWFDTVRRDTKLSFKHVPVKLENRGLGFVWGKAQSGMDNTPRGRGVKSFFWMDAVAQQALSALYIARLSEQLGDKATARKFMHYYKENKRKLNLYYWDDKDGFYYDLAEKDSSFIKVRTPAVYWAMLAEVPSKKQAARLARYAEDPMEFGGKYPWPTVSRRDKNFVTDGNYWKGSVWLPTAYMATKALEKYGYDELAHKNAIRLLNQMATTYRDYSPHTIWECYSPSAPMPSYQQYGSKPRKRAAPDFCGWSALGPISMFIENVIGFQNVDACKKLVEWKKYGDGRQGIRNLRFGTIITDIVAEDKLLKVNTNEDYLLKINGKKYRIKAGVNTLHIK